MRDDEAMLRASIRATLDGIAVPARPLGARIKRSPSIGPVLSFAVAAISIGMLATTGTSLWSERNLDPAASSSAGVSISPSSTLFRSDLAGLTFRLPVGWSAQEQRHILNRAFTRLAVAANGVLDPMVTETSADPAGGWRSVAPNRVVLELREQVGGPAPASPAASETEQSSPPMFPAAPSGQDGGFSTYSVRLAHLWRRFEFVAHVGPAASQADRDALRAILASLMFDPPTNRGMLQDGRVLVAGRVADFPVGSVTHFEAGPSGALPSFYLVRGSSHYFAHLDQAYLFRAGRNPCRVRFDAAAQMFVCDQTGDRWDLFGVFDGDHKYDLGWLGVIIWEDRVFVGGGLSAGERQLDQTPERKPR